MGITGLLPLLKSIQKPCNLKKFQGQTIGVDAYGWLHRGTVACATDLALGKVTTKFVDFAMHRVRMLVYFGVTPYLVFDGDNLPSKAAVERERAERREESKRRGLSLYHAGRASQAHQELQKAVDVTPEMARRLIEELKRANIQYIVAPYEADAQLAYLERKGIINGILSEDSDLLVFGAKRLLTKLDQHGDCVEINRADFTACRDISLIGWTDTEFRCMAILSGCDYLPSINKMGLKTAYRYVRKHKNIQKILRMLSFDGQFCVPTDYLERFRQAELTFLHHRVFCPIAQGLVMLTELKRGMKEEDLPFLGKNIDDETAIGVACGDLDPMSKNAIPVSPVSPKCPIIRGRSFEPRRVTLGSTADLKGNRRPLDAWFKPKRIPLAELDPNSLSYSSVGLRTIEANSDISLNARTNSSATQMRRSTSALPDSTISIEPVRRTAQRASFLARAATVSSYRSPKRPRLCSDASETSPTAAKVSPFFNSTDEPKPSLPTKKKGRKSRGSDFGIFSDDSLEEALKELPDLDKPAQEPKLAVFIDHIASRERMNEPTAQFEEEHSAPGEVLVPQSSPVVADRPEIGNEQTLASQESTSSLTNGNSSNSSQSTELTSISAESGPEVFENLLKLHTSNINQKLRKRFTSSQSLAASPGNMSGKEAEMVRIGQAALQEELSGVTKTHEVVEKLDEQDSITKQPASSIVGIPMGCSEYQRISLGNSAVSTAIDQRVNDIKGVRNSAAMQTSMGSEDLIVPNSEDDSEAQSESDDREKKRVLDLGCFTFKPK